MGKYSNGKKDSVWQFFHLLKFDTTKTNLADIKDFQKAKLFCSATFKEGRLNGAYKRFDLKTKMFILSKYKNDTLIDTLTTFLENGKINYVSNYNNVYYDTLWRHSRGETTYLKERLPYTTQYCYLRQKDYVTFEGYTDAVWYLVFDKKTKKLKKDKAGFDACELHKTERAEGVYKMVVDNTTATEFQIEDGRKHRIKDISLDK